jgi:pimeloyl-CoA synthetase
MGKRAKDETLLRLLKKCGVTDTDMEEIERDISRWGRGSVFIDVNETGRRLLRILPQP